MESWTFFLPLTLLYLAAMAAMASKLKNTNDAFKIKHEIFYVIVATAITSGKSLALKRGGGFAFSPFLGGLYFYPATARNCAKRVGVIAGDT